MPRLLVLMCLAIVASWSLLYVYGCRALMPEPPPADACAAMCAHLAALGCPEARGTPEGATCAEVCESIQTSGIIAWDLACMTAAADCAAVDGCE